MADLKKANEFLNKAEELLSWSDAMLAEIREHGKHGRIDSIKRLFFGLLGCLGSANDALGAAARLAGLQDWDSALTQQRKDDPLLNYFWAARNVDMHNTLIQWLPQLDQFTFQIIDAEKSSRAGNKYPLVHDPYLKIWCFLLNASSEHEAMRKLFKGTTPTQDRMETAGVEFVDMLHSLQLVPFSSTIERAKRKFVPPTMHLGKELQPGFEVAVGTVVNYYRDKLTELSRLIRSDQATKFGPIAIRTRS